MARNISRYYWICQITGWGLLSLMFIILNLIHNSYGTTKSIEKIMVLFFAGIFSTHMFRNLILKHNWLMLPVKKGFRKLYFGAIMTSLVAGFIRVAGYNLIALVISNQQFTLPIRLICFSTVECAFYISTWTLIYYLYYYIKKAHKERLQRFRLQLLFEEMKLQSAGSNVDIDFITNSLNQIQTLINKNPARARAEITEFSYLLRRAHLIA